MHVAIGEGVTARRVRISFRTAHPSAPRQQYYSVRALTLAVRCLCHGHATSCNVDAEGAKCDCQHGTCGGHCHRCCSGAPWAPSRACEEGRGCTCEERGECQYDDNGVELCVNCTENRAGPLCDRCLLGFYNSVSDGPCVSCDCDPEGSNGINHLFLSNNLDDGPANGTESTTVSPVTAYLASPDLSVMYVKNPPQYFQTVRIQLRRLASVIRGVWWMLLGFVMKRVSVRLTWSAKDVMCARLDTTDSAWIYLLGAGPATVRILLTPAIILPLGEAWLVTDALGNETVEASLDGQGNPFIISFEVEGWEHYYWLSSSFSGEQFQVYGGEIRAALFWGIVRGDTGGNPTFEPDVIIVGADGTKLACTNSSHKTPGQLKISVPILEGHWFTLGEEPEVASRMQLMDVLMDGPCGPCQHNTTGPNCERCLPGHYGNPVQGACKPCACPLFNASNNFSPNCVLASAEGDEYVCTQCPDGYSGDHCEKQFVQTVRVWRVAVPPHHRHVSHLPGQHRGR
ncbi:Wing blister, isoform G [Operophtera brumata]|uniref:Wing blister, isoform G n=1 Tax=Operophtera brumata TaxID=104452 RepID=A0A0L7L940_OPEBR|nr:Wing blister, isoform G [Operophtera brumata]